MKELIERLREIDCGKAADFIEQQAAEITELKESVSDLRAAATILKEEREAALAKSSAMEAVEPLFYYRPTCNGEMYEGPHHAKSVGGRMLREEKPTEWIALYTAPKVAQPSKPTFAEWCATNWDGPPSANARDAYNRIIGGQQP